MSRKFAIKASEQLDRNYIKRRHRHPSDRPLTNGFRPYMQLYDEVKIWESQGDDGRLFHISQRDNWDEYYSQDITMTRVQWDQFVAFIKRHY